MKEKMNRKATMSGAQTAKLRTCKMIKNIIDSETRSDHIYAEMIRDLPSQYLEYERDLNGIRMDIHRRRLRLTEIYQNLKCG